MCMYVQYFYAHSLLPVWLVGAIMVVDPEIFSVLLDVDNSILKDQILLQCMVTCGGIVFFFPRQCVVYAPLWYHLSCCSCRPRRLAVFACVVGVDANCKEAVGLEK